MLIIREGSCPEPTLRVAGGIVHPSRLTCDLGNEPQVAVGAQVADVPACRKHPTIIVLNRGDGPDSPWDFIAANGVEHPVLVDLVAKDPARQDVDVEQLGVAIIPTRALAKLSLLGRAGNWVESRHGSFSFRRERHSRPGARRHAGLGADAY